MRTAINSTLAARFSLHSDDQLTLADSVADKVDKRVQAQWNKIYFALKSKKSQAEKKLIIRAALYDLWINAHQEMKKGFEEIANNSFVATKKIFGEVIPTGHLNLLSTVTRLQESKASIKKKMADAIFKPLAPEKVEQIVKGTTAGMSWQGRLAQQSNLASPEQLATLVTSGFNAGATPETLAALIRPQVAGVASSARRIARNESMRIAHETRMEAYADLGEMVSGYQIHATMDSRVRPEHAARSGTVYSKKPKGNERPMSEMPRPPLEADGTVAHNCRCWITPVLEIQTHIEEDPAAKAVFTDAAGRLIPNPAVYTQWFDKANQTDKEKVVGVKRLKLIKELVPIGQSIQWGHFINPETGKLLGFEELRVESEIQRKERVGKFDAVIAKRLELTKQVYTYGYIPPEPPPKVAAITPPEPKPITPPAVDPKLGVVPINPIAEPKVTAVAIPADSVVVPANPEVATATAAPLALPPTAALAPAPAPAPKIIEMPKHLLAAPERTILLKRKMLESTSKLNDMADELGVTFSGVQTPIEREQLLTTVTEKLGQHLGEVIATGQPKIRTDERGILGIIKTNKFLSQFSTKTSKGLLSTDRRREVEFINLGVPKDHPDNKRPVYGYIHKEGMQDNTRFYGTFQFILKREVLDFATVTYGDSLNESLNVVGSPANNPSGFSVPMNGRYGVLNTQRLKKNDTAEEYLEAQFHGELTLDHVESLVINLKPPKTNAGDENATKGDKQLHYILEEMEKRGISVVFKQQ